MSPATGLPSTATHIISVTYCSRFSVNSFVASRGSIHTVVCGTGTRISGNCASKRLSDSGPSSGSGTSLSRGSSSSETSVISGHAERSPSVSTRCEVMSANVSGSKASPAAPFVLVPSLALVCTAAISAPAAASSSDPTESSCRSDMTDCSRGSPVHSSRGGLRPLRKARHCSCVDLTMSIANAAPNVESVMRFCGLPSVVL
eukprot:Amastigsp_a845531_5.p3 type:complete len:202 gc:universal Amastigsp_a845531_5:1307-702(-)